MPDSINERIAKLRGCKYVGRYDAERPGPGSSVVLHEHPPLYDSDWNATGELLEQCFDVGIEKFKDGFAVSLSIDGQTWGKGTATTLPAAVAEAWLKVSEAKGE